MTNVSCVCFHFHILTAFQTTGNDIRRCVISTPSHLLFSCISAFRYKWKHSFLWKCSSTSRVPIIHLWHSICQGSQSYIYCILMPVYKCCYVPCAPCAHGFTWLLTLSLTLSLLPWIFWRTKYLNPAKAMGRNG